MRIRTFENEPLVNKVVQVQRALSQAHTEAELMFAFARNFHEISGCTHWLDLSVEGLPAGHYRIMDRVWFADPDMNEHYVSQYHAWDQSLDTVEVFNSRIISKLLLTDVPKLATDVDVLEDATLAALGVEQSSVLAIPVFHDGTVQQWILLIRPMALGQNLDQIPDAISHINTFSRALSRQKLLNQVKLLHEQVERQFEDVLKAQRSLLPQGKPEEPRIDFGVSYVPCELAGGDYYDFHPYDTEKLGFAIADVSGHGAKAAVVMSMLRSLFSAHKQMSKEPENVVDDMNKVLMDITDGSTFVTALFIGYEFDLMNVRITNAGHPKPIWLDKTGKLKHCPDDASPPLGILRDLPVNVINIPLIPGDRLVAYTDGLSEASDQEGNEFGVMALENLISSLSHLDAQCAADQIMHDVRTFSQRALRQDDMCVLVIDYVG